MLIYALALLWAMFQLTDDSSILAKTGIEPVVSRDNANDLDRLPFKLHCCNFTAKSFGTYLRQCVCARSFL